MRFIALYVDMLCNVYALILHVSWPVYSHISLTSTLCQLLQLYHINIKAIFFI